ncbi:MAG: response regulator [Leptospiraceae bacterium]|nr:response regulator [Leptospiraceae bacterium]
MKKILIAEDEFITSNELKNHLIKLGYTKIEAAFDNAETIQKVESFRPELILMDINMGKGVGPDVVDGIDIATIIRLNHDVPIIYVTAYADNDTIKRAKLTEPYAYILKPFNERELGIAIDIALYKYESEKKLAEANKKLEEMNKIKDKFFSIVAHDLKSPFSGLIGISDMLIQKHSSLDSQKILKSITLINSTAKHTYNLLENLLTWSRIQINKVPFEPRLHKIQNIVQDVEMLAHYSGGDKKGIVIKHDIEPEDVEVRIDRNMIHTVYRNLISNAIKFTATGNTITIGYRLYKEEDKLLCFVKDEGVGMDQTEQEKIFKLDQPFSKKGLEGERGAGLGLVLCKEFVEKNGGKIWVESSKGNGSTFYFTLKKKKL